MTALKMKHPHIIRRLLFALGFLSLVAGLWAESQLDARVDLLAAISGGDVDFTLKFPVAAKESFPGDWVSFSEGQLKLSEKMPAQLSSKRAFADFHLVLEFKWGEKTLGSQATKARDAGVFLGSARSGTTGGIEVILREGCLGGLSPISAGVGVAQKETLFLEGEFMKGADGAFFWKTGASRTRLTQGIVHWSKHDPSWVDRKGFRGRDDLESPPGEWNRLEVVLARGSLKCVVNGVVVNEALTVYPAEWHVGLNGRGAEMTIRRFELHPVGSYHEKWSSIQASGGTDVSVRAGQKQALSPEESLKKIHLDGPYEAQLVASEPLVLDPVECAWDAKGRLFVADMRDYPLGPKNPGDPWLSRVQMLTDEDGDGRMDKAVTFADHLDHVQGLLPYKDGLIVTTRTQILFLRDTNGDGVADVRQPLINGFNPRFSQLQVSAPRWGPDGCVYFNNGLDAKEIYPTEQPNSAIGVPRSNFRWDPAAGKLEPVTGFGQYGAAFDDFGRYFFCSNRSPVMFAVMPLAAVQRNPWADIEKGWEDIAPAGAETRVYPVQITHTTADAHAGTNTACSGLGVYRGRLMPELRNNVFVPEPTGQLVTRYRIEENGASLRAVRVGERTEFFRSSDEWCRPVNFTTGPDGAIYICDIYRRWIDHARFFPEDFVKTHDMREGEAHGRIWRIVPKGMKVAKIEPAPSSVAALKTWLKHPDAWQRETALRLLAEKEGRVDLQHGGEQINGAARRTFISILNHPDSVIADLSALAKERAESISRLPEDPWITKAVLSSSQLSAGRVLDYLLGDEVFIKEYSRQRAFTVQGLARVSAVVGGEEDFAAALQNLSKDSGRLTWWKAALMQGVAEGIPKASGHPWGKSLVEFVQTKNNKLRDSAVHAGGLLKQMDAALSDPTTAAETRLACLSLLEQRKWEETQPVLRQLLMPDQKPELQAAAIGILKKVGGEKASTLAYELLPNAGPFLRKELVALLSASAKTALELFKRMDRGEISPALVEIETRWRYQRGAGELRDLAVKLFGQPSEDRAAVVADYLPAITHAGDRAKGRQLFETLCTSCHRHGNAGMEVGPSLSDVKVKPPEALLSDILDPNRMFEARFSAYQVEMRDGRILIGLVSAETSESVTLTLQGGSKEILVRGAMQSMKSLDRSLMPAGLEAVLSKDQMADLLSFLRGGAGEAE